MIQMAWFRLKYPEGRIAVQVNSAKDCFVATARVYPNYKDAADCYLAEATASRGYCRRNLRFHHGNGHRLLLLELLYEMQALDFSFLWQVKI